MLSQETITIVKSTVPVLQEHGHAITKRFYARLFENNPQLKNLFNQTNQKQDRQSMALANAVYAAANYIDQLEAIIPAIQPILHKHRSLQITPEMYDIVGENLLAAIKEVLGDAATDEIINAWAEAYGEIASVFIALEATLYQEVKENAFEGFVPFEVTEIIKESSDVKSFVLTPPDGMRLAPYQPGQYISVQAEIPTEEILHHRQYSLSKAYDGVSYRFAAKKDGIVSTHLHDNIRVGDVLRISAPAGHFVLDGSDSPVVLVGGGIGLTPLLSLADQALRLRRKVTVLHAVKDHADRPFAEQLEDFASRGAEILYYAEQNADADVVSGYIDAATLERLATDAEVFICGPEAMLQYVVNACLAATTAEHIHYEVFGPSLAVSTANA